MIAVTNNARKPKYMLNGSTTTEPSTDAKPFMEIAHGMSWFHFR